MTHGMYHLTPDKIKEKIVILFIGARRFIISGMLDIFTNKLVEAFSML